MTSSSGGKKLNEVGKDEDEIFFPIDNCKLGAGFPPTPIFFSATVA